MGMCFCASDRALALCFWNDNNLFLILLGHEVTPSDPIEIDFVVELLRRCKLIQDTIRDQEARQRVQRPQSTGEKLVLGKVF